jgi:hypothetical protein
MGGGRWAKQNTKMRIMMGHGHCCPQVRGLDFSTKNGKAKQAAGIGIGMDGVFKSNHQLVDYVKGLGRMAPKEG